MFVTFLGRIGFQGVLQGGPKSGLYLKIEIPWSSLGKALAWEPIQTRFGHVFWWFLGAPLSWYFDVTEAGRQSESFRWRVSLSEAKPGRVWEGGVRAPALMDPWRTMVRIWVPFLLIQNFMKNSTPVKPTEK